MFTYTTFVFTQAQGACHQRQREMKQLPWYPQCPFWPTMKGTGCFLHPLSMCESPCTPLICHYLFPSLLRLYNEEVGSATHHISTVSLHLSTVSTHCSPPRCHRESAVGGGNDLNPEEGRNNSPSVGVTEGFHLRCLQQWKQLCWIGVQHQQKSCQIHLSLYSPVMNK